MFSMSSPIIAVLGLCTVLTVLLSATHAQSAAYLSLTPNPNTTFKVNDNITLVCMLVDGNAADYQIQWYINNSLIVEPAPQGVSVGNGGSHLSIQGSLMYGYTSVTCTAAGDPSVSNVTTLLILERDILHCSIANDTLEAGKVCFTCNLSPIPQSLKISYRFLMADNNKLVVAEDFTTNLGSQEFSKCVEAPATGMYSVYIYIVDSFTVSSLGNPAYVIDVVVQSVSTSTGDGGTGSPMTDEPEGPTDRNNHLLLTLRTWKYRIYVYVGAGLVVLVVILILFFMTTCTLCLIMKHRPVDPFDLDEIDPVSNPFRLSSKSMKGKKVTSNRTKKTTSSKNGGQTVTTTTTSTHGSSSSSVGSSSSSYSHTSIELVQHRGSIRRPLETIKESEQDNVSVESMYDQLEGQPNNTYEDIQHDLTYEPMDEHRMHVAM